MDWRDLWNYFGEIAAASGRDADGNVKSYSVEYFYRTRDGQPKNPENLPTLLRAYLGDKEARESLDWEAPLASEEEIAEWLCSDKPPYPSQIGAILSAISRPLTLIQGPPGTGKTEMILNLLSVIRGLDPQSTAAIVSSNNEVITNITEKIFDEPGFENLRGCYSQLGSKSRREEWQSEHPEYQSFFISDGTRFSAAFLGERPFVSSTINSLQRIFVPNVGFDYVIVDECSQVGTVLGLLAMGSCVGRLILIGDENQLPAIIKEDIIAEVNESFPDVPECHRVIEGSSFLGSCTKVFSGKARLILLNEHFRCHPAIIGFCNEAVYGGGLTIRTRDDGRFPIRILWYEGEYSERITKGLSNTRQTDIFMKEEWPLLKSRLEENPDLGICVIAPYREPLETLKKALL